MIRSENYGGGVRWHCTECDTNVSVPGSHIPHISWTNGPPPAHCRRCTPTRECKLTLKLDVLLPVATWGQARDHVGHQQDTLEIAILNALKALDINLTDYAIAHDRRN